MTNDNKFNGWTKIIDSVKTPLGFLTLLVLILDGILLATAALTDKVSMLAPVVLLGLVIVCFFVIVYFKPEALYPPVQKRPVRVNVRFPGMPIGEISRLEFRDSAFEIRDENGLRRCPTNPTLGYDGQAMTFILTENVEPTASVNLNLVELNGRRRRVPPFNPYNVTLESIEG